MTPEIETDEYDTCLYCGADVARDEHECYVCGAFEDYDGLWQPGEVAFVDPE